MVDATLLMGGFWVILGTAVLIPASLIAFGGRPDLHVHYDESVDPTYVSRRAGPTALAMGLAMIAFGVHQVVVGYSPIALGGLLVSLFVLSWLTKKFARGWGYRPDSSSDRANGP